MRSKLLLLLAVLIICFGACTIERNNTAMGWTLQPGQSALIACAPTGGAAGAPTVLGGTRSTGGRSAATGGRASTGGSSATCAAIVLPTQANNTPAATKMAKHHRLNPRHHRRPGRARATPEATNICSATHLANCATLDQGETGSCTGNAHVMAISTQPFPGATHCNETDARAAYQGGTCIDNSCQVPCTCTSCTKAFCPTTSANDTGSQTGSVVQWMVDVGWLGSFTTADTTATLESCLVRGPAVIGIDFYNSMFTPTANGQLQVTTSSGLAGGHDMNVAILDITHRIAPVDAVWVHNSWGDTWGWCIDNECGYAWIAVSDLTKLHFDGDCPTP